MPIDLDKAVGAVLPDVAIRWTPDDVILYHLGIGAGDRPTDPRELAYVYEQGLKVLPSFCVIPAMEAVRGMHSVPGLTFNPALVLHGEHEIEMMAPLPVAANVINSGRIKAIYDKRKAAVVVIETETKDETGRLLCYNRCSVFLRGEGSFGGPSGPKTARELPNRSPDQVIESPTLPQQALLYRLSGDKNPLHADPHFAGLAGFDRPILHGLCSYGIVCKAIVEHCFDGDTTRMQSYSVRFRDVVYPGETIVTSLWNEDGRILVQAHVKERQSLVLTNACVTING
ncbi:MAG: MaoC/PaaZ C-terminal domain-containing protein [Planctomycetota bacterium]